MAFEPSKFYFFIFKNNKIVAFTNNEMEIERYFEYRNKLHYEVRIYKYKDLPNPIKQKLADGEWEKELVMGGSYGQYVLTIHGEKILIDNIDALLDSMPETLGKMEYLLSFMKFNASEKRKIDTLFTELSSIIDPDDDGAGSEDLESTISYEGIIPAFIKKGLI